jgi:hypothetical protein
MADRDPLATRLSGFAQDARHDVVPPAYDALVATSRRRRRGGVTVMSIATIVVIGTVWVGVRGTPGQDAGPTLPADSTTGRTTPGPTSAPSDDSTASGARAPLTAEQIIDAPDSYLVAFAVSQRNPQAQVSVWRCREQPSCQGWRGGVAVTDDGFATRAVLDLPRHANLNAVDLGNDTFLVGDAPGGLLVRADGATTAMTVDRAASPLAPGEVVVALWQGTEPRKTGGLDPETGRVHPLALPPSDGVELQTTPNGLIYGVASTDTARGTSQRLLWSDDRAASWHEQTIPDLPANTYLLPLDSQRDGTMPFLVTGDGATLAPIVGFYGSTDGGRTWQSFEAESDPRGYLSTGLVQQDGSLLVNVIAWSDSRVSHPSDRPLGIYRSDGADWGHLQSIGELPSQVDASYVASPFELVSAIPDAGEVYASSPGLGGWQEVAAR